MISFEFILPKIFCFGQVRQKIKLILRYINSKEHANNMVTALIGVICKLVHTNKY